MTRCHPRILSRIAACVALLVLAAVVPAQATLSDIQFESRFPGPFWISTYDHTQPSEKEGTSTNPGWNHGLSHPYTDWTIGSIQGPITLSDGSEQTTWAGCSVPLRNGTFDVRLTTRMLAADVQYLKYEVRPQFTGNVAIHGFRWVKRLAAAMLDNVTEVRTLLPATSAMYIRDALTNLSFQTYLNYLTTPENPFTPYLVEQGAVGQGFYYSRLNIADVVSIHGFNDSTDCAQWGVALYGLDPGNVGIGQMLVGSNASATSGQSMEFGFATVLTNDQAPNNGANGGWITVGEFHLRALPCNIRKELAWWENVQYMRDEMLQCYSLVPEELLSDSPSTWVRTCTLGTGYELEGGVHKEVRRVGDFFRKYGYLGENLTHYAVAVTHWTDAPYTIPATPTNAFASFLNRIQGTTNTDEVHVIAYLHSGSYAALPEAPAHPLESIRLRNDKNQVYYAKPNAYRYYPVDVSDPTFGNAFSVAIDWLKTSGCGGVYFDDLFGELHRDYHPPQGRSHVYLGADPDYHADMVARVKQTEILWPDALILGEQNRLGNRYAAGAFDPTGLRSIPGGFPVPFIDALVHEYRLTAGAGDLTEQWAGHAYYWQLNHPGETPPKEDLSNILHDYVAGFVAGRLLLDGRSSSGHNYFESDPADLPAGSSPWVEAGYEVLKDCADDLYPRMMIWRYDTLALQHGRMLLPPEPHGLENWFTIYKQFYVPMAPPSWADGTRTVSYEAQRYPVSFWSLPDEPDKLTLFIGNPEYKAASLRFVFQASDYPELAGSSWDVTREAGPGSSGESEQLHNAATTFDFTVEVPALGFTRVAFKRH